MRWYCPDNYDIWEAEERRKEQLLERLPVCAECKDPIQQRTAVCLEGVWYCDECLEMTGMINECSEMDRKDVDML